MSMVSCLSRECSDQSEADIRVPDGPISTGSSTKWPVAGHSPPSHIKASSSAKADDPVFGAANVLSTPRRLLDTPLSRGMTAEAPLAFRRFWPQIRAGRLAVDEPLANRVRSG